ncbi:hypothetical protein RHMOL_Rhmol02G0149800 [Rhododendron molle]|uniref:Uncharacterized protein n=1 Tax=Rhododendron molle TaxID=49168 RepID=A0ACC0PQ30_RHOML|nr:hypothetical protein RHMOL_Rhmol02G0149800 [Rhododendron molle]
MVSMVTTNAWPKLGKVNSNPGLKTSAKAAEHGAGVILTPPHSPSTRPLSVIPPVQEDKPEGEATAWTKRKILLTNEVKIGRLSKHLKKVPIVYENGQVMIPTNIFENRALKWKNAIVSCFVDKRLSYFQVRSWAQRVWKTDAEDVVTLDNDDFTQNHSRLTFARVCIEVEAAKEISKSFVVNLGYASGSFFSSVESQGASRTGSPRCSRANFQGRAGNEDKAWEEVKRKKDHRSPLSMPLVTSSPCRSSVSSDVLRKDDMRNVPHSVMVSFTCFDVLESCDTNNYSCVTDQVSHTSPIVPIHNQASKKQEVPMAPRRSTCFREPPRIPLEGDFVGP